MAGAFGHHAYYIETREWFYTEDIFKPLRFLSLGKSKKNLIATLLANTNYKKCSIREREYQFKQKL